MVNLSPFHWIQWIALVVSNPNEPLSSSIKYRSTETKQYLELAKLGNSFKLYSKARHKVSRKVNKAYQISNWDYITLKG